MGGSGAAPACKLVDVLRDGLGQATAATLPLGAQQRKVLGALLACRTEAAGGHRFRCADCEREFFVPHRCGNRHCPQCQGREAAQWLERQSASVLSAPYFHVVFTLPHGLNPLIRQNQVALYALLFSAASSTLLDFARQRIRGVPGVTAVLHTWSQTLAEHYHLHCIVSAGALSDDGSRWIKGNARYLFPIKALSKVFRARMRDGILALFAAGKLQFHTTITELKEREAFGRWLHPWCAANGWFTPSGPLPGQSKCWDTSRATRTGWPSATVVCLHSIPSATPSASATRITLITATAKRWSFPPRNSYAGSRCISSRKASKRSVTLGYSVTVTAKRGSPPPGRCWRRRLRRHSQQQPPPPQRLSALPHCQ